MRRTPLEKRLARALRFLVEHHEYTMKQEGKVDVPCGATRQAREVLQEFEGLGRNGGPGKTGVPQR